MRPTLLNCRDPSQRTPDFITPEVDYKGNSITFKETIIYDQDNTPNIKRKFKKIKEHKSISFLS
jgi:hypothetical protein